MRVKYPIVNLMKNENPWVTFTNRLIFKQNNCQNIVFTGAPGSGKSWGMLSYFCLLDPDFELEGNFFFRAKLLMKALKDGKFGAGKKWGYDEAGIDANNLKYYDAINKGLNALFQTSRHKNYVFGLTLPYLNMLSKGVRVLMTAQFRCVGWNKYNKTKIVPRALEYNGEIDKFYRKRLLIRDKGKVAYCNEIRLPKPPKNMIKEYERMKGEFTTGLYSDIYDEMEAQEQHQKSFRDRYLITDREEETLTLLKDGLLKRDVAEVLKCTVKNIEATITRLKKKGIEIILKRDENNRGVRYTVVDPRNLES